MGPDGRQGGGLACRQEADAGDAHRLELALELVFDHVGQRTDHHQRRGVAGVGRQLGHECGQAGILALGEGGFDAAARIVQHPHAGQVKLGQAAGGTRQIQLDDLGRARADEEQQADVGPALQQAVDHAVKLFVHIGQAGEITLVDDGGGEPGLGEDHHAGSGLDQMRTGARAHHQKKRVLHLAVQPDDAGEAAEDLALASLLQHRHVGARRGGLDGDDRAHRTPSAVKAAPSPMSPMSLARVRAVACASRRAALSLSRNCVALMA
jgi:hypothetical protein